MHRHPTSDQALQWSAAQFKRGLQLLASLEPQVIHGRYSGIKLTPAQAADTYPHAAADQTIGLFVVEQLGDYLLPALLKPQARHEADQAFALALAQVRGQWQLAVTDKLMVQPRQHPHAASVLPWRSIAEHKTPVRPLPLITKPTKAVTTLHQSQGFPQAVVTNPKPPHHPQWKVEWPGNQLIRLSFAGKTQQEQQLIFTFWKLAHEAGFRGNDERLLAEWTLALDFAQLPVSLRGALLRHLSLLGQRYTIKLTTLSDGFETESTQLIDETQEADQFVDDLAAETSEEELWSQEHGVVDHQEDQSLSLLTQMEDDESAAVASDEDFAEAPVAQMEINEPAEGSNEEYFDEGPAVMEEAFVSANQRVEDVPETMPAEETTDIIVVDEMEENAAPAIDEQRMVTANIDLHADLTEEGLSAEEETTIDHLQEAIETLPIPVDEADITAQADMEMVLPTVEENVGEESSLEAVKPDEPPAHNDQPQTVLTDEHEQHSEPPIEAEESPEQTPDADAELMQLLKAKAQADEAVAAQQLALTSDDEKPAISQGPINPPAPTTNEAGQRAKVRIVSLSPHGPDTFYKDGKTQAEVTAIHKIMMLMARTVGVANFMPRHYRLTQLNDYVLTDADLRLLLDNLVILGYTYTLED